MNIALDILMDALLAAVAALGFGAVSNPTRRSLPYICLLAAIAHAVRFSLMNYAGTDIVLGSFVGALTVGFLSLWAGKRSKTPLSCLFIPALLPMVPGMYAYRSVFALILFIQAIAEPQQAEYLIMFGSNFFISIMVVFVLAVGASFPKFILPRISHTMTR